MTVTAVDLINAALRIIGTRAITAIDDTTSGGAIAGDVYTFVRDQELRAHTWNCAAARARLARLRVVPTYEFSYAYALPSDWLRTVSVHDNDAGAGQANYKQETILTSEALTNGTFDTDTTWTKGTGWTIASGIATKTAGSGSDLSQTATLAASATYRVCFLIQGMSAGILTPKFTGGVTVTGTARSVDGYYAEEITADAGGNTTFVLTASAAFNGTVDFASCVRIDGAASPAIISTSEAIFLRYVRQVTNPDQMDPLLRNVLTLRMAKIFALGLANSSSYTQMLDAELKSALRQAKSTDAIEDTPDQLPAGSWVTSRFGRSWDSRW